MSSYLEYQATDNGNCRIYYKDGKTLHCFQEDSPGTFILYICSKDGEPSYERYSKPSINRLPHEDEVTARNFRNWWAKSQYVLEQAVHG